MNTLLTVRDIEDLLRRGEAVPETARLTPAARDVLRASASPLRQTGASAATGGTNGAGTAVKTAAEPIGLDLEVEWSLGADPSSPAEIEAYFRSVAVEALKRRICDIGRRVWEKDYVDGDGGNITVRVGDGLVLCTPTLISKGFMR